MILAGVLHEDSNRQLSKTQATNFDFASTSVLERNKSMNLANWHAKPGRWPTSPGSCELGNFAKEASVGRTLVGPKHAGVRLMVLFEDRTEPLVNGRVR